jgi:hypothetical protein
MASVVMIWPAFAWHAIRGVHRGTEHVPIFDHHRAGVAADADGHVMAFRGEFRIAGNGFLHLRGRVQRVVRHGERRHHFVTHRLDDCTVMFFGGLPHDIDAGCHHFASALVPELFIEPR